MLPNFLIIGAMKAGTTSLHSYLATHPDVFMSVEKEPNFFSSEKNWKKGISWYESFFRGQEGKKAVGESSVNYSKYPYYGGVPERISSLVPEMRIIYVLRNPVERIYSHYLHNFYSGIEKDPIEKAIAERPLYIHASMYHMQIQRYLSCFPSERLMIVLLDDLKCDPVGTVQRIFEFLGVDSTFVPPNIRVVKHQTKAKRGRDNMLMHLLRKASFYGRLSYVVPDGAKRLSAFVLKTRVEKPEPLSDGLREKLMCEIVSDIEKLSCFLGRDLNAWLEMK